MLAALQVAFAPVDQEYLFLARQLQALSLGVHIPLVCFGIAFPAMVMFAEWHYLRTGDRVYLTIAKRWSKVMLALFAVGVVTGTISSFAARPTRCAANSTKRRISARWRSCSQFRLC